MPSKLPIIKANTTQDNIEKMRVIASTNKRSIAKELEWLIERHIAEFESIHGTIDTTITIEKVFEVSKDENLSKDEKRRLAWEMGKLVGEQKGEEIAESIKNKK